MTARPTLYEGADMNTNFTQRGALAVVSVVVTAGWLFVAIVLPAHLSDDAARTAVSPSALLA